MQQRWNQPLSLNSHCYVAELNLSVLLKAQTITVFPKFIFLFRTYFSIPNTQMTALHNSGIQNVLTVCQKLCFDDPIH